MRPWTLGRDCQSQILVKERLSSFFASKTGFAGTSAAPTNEDLGSRRLRR